MHDPVAKPTDAAAAHGHEFSRVHVSPSPRGSRSGATLRWDGPEIRSSVRRTSSQIESWPRRMSNRFHIPERYARPAEWRGKQRERRSRAVSQPSCSRKRMTLGRGARKAGSPRIAVGGGQAGENSVRAREMPGRPPRYPRQEEAAFNALRGGGAPLSGRKPRFFRTPLRT
jgi:hypothetical protein